MRAKYQKWDLDILVTVNTDLKETTSLLGLITDRKPYPNGQGREIQHGEDKKTEHLSGAQWKTQPLSTERQREC